MGQGIGLDGLMVKIRLSLDTHLHIILAKGPNISPQIELYFRETARIDGDPGPIRSRAYRGIDESGRMRVQRRFGFPQI